MTCAWRTTNQKPTSDLFSKFITNFLSNDVFTFSWCKSSTLQILCLSTSRNGNRDNCTLTYTTIKIIKMQLIIIMNCFTLIFIFIYMQQTDYKQMKTDWIRCLNYFFFFFWSVPKLLLDSLQLLRQKINRKCKKTRQLFSSPKNTETWKQHREIFIHNEILFNNHSNSSIIFSIN